jgi:hypothetical protein
MRGWRISNIVRVSSVGEELERREVTREAIGSVGGSR